MYVKSVTNEFTFIFVTHKIIIIIQRLNLKSNSLWSAEIWFEIKIKIRCYQVIRNQNHDSENNFKSYPALLISRAHFCWPLDVISCVIYNKWLMCVMKAIAGSATKLFWSQVKRSQWRQRLHDIQRQLKHHQWHLLLHVSFSVDGTL